MVLVKILLDIREYERLKKCEASYMSQTIENEQTGGGLESSEDRMRQIIRDELAKVDNVPHDSTLVTPQAEELPPITMPPISSGTQYKTSVDPPEKGIQSDKVESNLKAAGSNSPWYFLGPI